MTTTCFVSKKDFVEHWPQIGERVWYWARRRGQKAHIKVGALKSYSEDHTLARVQLSLFDQARSTVTVQTVETNRLHRGALPDRPPRNVRHRSDNAQKENAHG